jgi:hypothetical protein
VYPSELSDLRYFKNSSSGSLLEVWIVAMHAGGDDPWHLCSSMPNFPVGCFLKGVWVAAMHTGGNFMHICGALLRALYWPDFKVSFFKDCLIIFYYYVVALSCFLNSVSTTAHSRSILKYTSRCHGPSN